MHVHNRQLNPLRLDPTRTTLLRKAFVKESDRRFVELQKQITQLVEVEDAFGLAEPGTPMVSNKRWVGMSSAQQVEQFRKWVESQVNKGILTTVDPSDPTWMSKYISEAYEKGAARSFDDYRKLYAAAGPASDYKFYSGGKFEFLGSFRGPAAAERVQYLASRTFQDMKGVTTAMGQQMNRVLADGMIQGKSPREVARDLNKTVSKIGIQRARTVARTETIRAHAEGQLDSLTKLGVEEVGVMVEWSTAGDDLVCPLCLPMNGVVLKIQEARGGIPRHPNCVLGNMVVEAPGLMALMKGSYTGPIVNLVTAQGRRISVTVNHVMLTQRGWVFAKDLTETDYLIDCTQGDRSLFVPKEDQNQPTISEVFTAAVEMSPIGSITKTPAVSHQLHGDGEFINSEVEIVCPTGPLRSQLQPTLAGKSVKEFFAWRNVFVSKTFLLDRPRSLASLLLRTATAADRLVSSLGVADVLSARSLIHHQLISDRKTAKPNALVTQAAMDGVGSYSEALRQSLTTDPTLVFCNENLIGKSDAIDMGTSDVLTKSQIDAGTFQAASDRIGTSTKLFGDFLRAFPGLITFDQIVGVDVTHVEDTPVYDGMTQSSAYLVNGFISSNCRCAWIPAGVGESTKGQKRDKQSIADAFLKSIRREHPKAGSAAEARALSRWMGADTKVSKLRPKSLVGRILPQKGPGGKKLPPVAAPQLWGHQPTAVIRWMGQEGWTWQEAQQVLAKKGLQVPEGTIKTQLSQGKSFKKPPAALTEPQIADLKALRQGLLSSGDEVGEKIAQKIASAGDAGVESLTRESLKAKFDQMGLKTTTEKQNWVKQWVKENQDMDVHGTPVPYWKKAHGMSGDEQMRKVVFEGKEFYFNNTDNVAVLLTDITEGNVPQPLWDSFDELIFSKQKNKADAYWAKAKKQPDFKSLATGGDRGVVVYNDAELRVGNFNHELGHNFAQEKWGKPQPPNGSNFYKAWANDTPVSSYGATGIEEDFAESVRLWSNTLQKKHEYGTQFPASAGEFKITPHQQFAFDHPDKFDAIAELLGGSQKAANIVDEVTDAYQQYALKAKTPAPFDKMKFTEDIADKINQILDITDDPATAKKFGDMLDTLYYAKQQGGIGKYTGETMMKEADDLLAQFAKQGLTKEAKAAQADTALIDEFSKKVPNAFKDAFDEYKFDVDLEDALFKTDLDIAEDFLAYLDAAGVEDDLIQEWKSFTETIKKVSQGQTQTTTAFKPSNQELLDLFEKSPGVKELAAEIPKELEDYFYDAYLGSVEDIQSLDDYVLAFQTKEEVGADFLDYMKGMLDEDDPKDFKILQKIEAVTKGAAKTTTKVAADVADITSLKLTEDYSSSQLLQWMGSKGHSFDDAKKVLYDLQVKVSDGTIKQQLYLGKSGKKVPPLLKTDQAIALEKYKGTGSKQLTKIMDQATKATDAAVKKVVEKQIAKDKVAQDVVTKVDDAKIQAAVKKLDAVTKKGYVDIDELFAYQEQPYDVAGAEFLQKGKVVRLKLQGNNKLVATQEYVETAKVKTFLNDAKLAMSKGDAEEALPKIYQYNGKLYIHDGHHRISAAKLLDDDYIDVVLMVDPTNPGKADLVAPFLSDSKITIKELKSNAIPKLADLKKVQDLPGSTRPELMLDASTGEQWVVKSTQRGLDPAHLRSEALADDLYRRLGIKVPKSAIVESAEGPAKVSEFLPGKTLQKWLVDATPAEKEAMFAQIREGFVADALLANHDVAGMSMDNIFVVGKQAYRIDNGGALTFRAQGGAKRNFGGIVEDLKTLRDAKINPNTAEIFKGITDDQIDAQIRDILDRREEFLAGIKDQSLRNTMEQRLDYLKGQIKGKTVDPGSTYLERIAKRQVEPGITKDTAERVVRSRINGTAVKSDRDLVEDNNILLWQEKDKAGQEVTKIQFKVTRAGSEKLEETLKRSGVDVADLQRLADPYYQKVLNAAKTVASHASDGKYNQSTLMTMNAAESELKILLSPVNAKDLTPDKKKMYEYYLAKIEDINKAKAAGKAPGIVDVYVPPKTANIPTSGIQARKTTQAYRLTEIKNGHAVATGGVQDVTGGGAQRFVVSMSDGTEISIAPRGMTTSQKPGLALEGTVEVTIPKKVTTEVLQEAMQKLESLGLDMAAPTKEYEELLYLHRSVYLRNDHGQVAYKAIFENPNLTDAEKVKQIKDWAKFYYKTDFKYYAPEGQTMTGYGDGFRYWMRWDLPPEKIEQEMKDFVLSHSVSGSSEVSDVLNKMLQSGGEATTTIGRIRKGVSVGQTGGMSSSTDVETGGASYFFTRIAEAKSPRGELNFKIRNLARQDAVTYDGDKFGRISALHTRKSTIAQYKTTSKAYSNETIFKNGLSLLDDLDFIEAGTIDEAKKVLDVFTKNKITQMNDGRPVKSIIRVKGKVAKL